MRDVKFVANMESKSPSNVVHKHSSHAVHWHLSITKCYQSKWYPSKWCPSKCCPSKWYPSKWCPSKWYLSITKFYLCPLSRYSIHHMACLCIDHMLCSDSVQCLVMTKWSCSPFQRQKCYSIHHMSCLCIHHMSCSNNKLES